MFPRLGMLALMLLLFVSRATAESQFPYRGYITEDDVYVRSGPGKNYYPTMKLNFGEEVEIYRHDPGGWYAVRPPAGSYSWVSGKYLETVEDDLARTTADRVVTRVGSEFSDIRDVIQIRLHQGEELIILGAKRFGEGPAEQIWYKVAPPPGEFRWIHGKFIDTRKPLERPRDPETRRNLLIDDAPNSNPADYARTGYTDDPSRDRFDTARYDDSDRYSTSDRTDRGDRHAADDRDSYGSHAPPVTARRRSSPSADDHGTGVSEHASSPSNTAEGTPLRGGDAWSSTDYEAEIEDIDLMLSEMVAEEPTVWDFHNLRVRSEYALSMASTALQRGKARNLLNKIQRFNEIQRRYEQIAQLTVDTDRRQQRLARAERVLDAEAPPRYASQKRYDGDGWLVRVVSKQADAPPFALVDQNGTVKTYVSPAPGVNLHNYVGREIGISGSRGFVPEYRTQHLTASRIEALDQSTLR
jgi:hypothetical protein